MDGGDCARLHIPPFSCATVLSRVRVPFILAIALFTRSYVNQLAEKGIEMSAYTGSMYEFIQKGHVVTATGNKTIINRFNLGTRVVGAVLDSAFTVGTAFIAALTGTWAPMFSTGYIDDSLTIRYMNDATSLPIVISPGLGNGAYASPTDPCQADSAIYVKLQTDRRGKRGRGSKHFSPFDEAMTTNGYLTNAALSLVQAFMTALNANPCFTIGLNPYLLHVVSQAESQLSINPTTISASIVRATGGSPPGYVVDKTVGTMRHRRYKTVT